MAIHGNHNEPRSSPGQSDRRSHQVCQLWFRLDCLCRRVPLVWSVRSANVPRLDKDIQSSATPAQIVEESNLGSWNLGFASAIQQRIYHRRISGHSIITRLKAAFTGWNGKKSQIDLSETNGPQSDLKEHCKRLYVFLVFELLGLILEKTPSEMEWGRDYWLKGLASICIF